MLLKIMMCTDIFQHSVARSEVVSRDVNTDDESSSISRSTGEFSDGLSSCSSPGPPELGNEELSSSEEERDLEGDLMSSDEIKECAGI
jgi:hypothetical protein